MKKEKYHKENLTPEELANTKSNLLLRKNELWQEIAEDLEKDAKEEHEELIQTIREEGDASLEELRESIVLSLIEMKYHELEKIEEALVKLEEGEYGRCVDCNTFIGRSRLEVLPYAVRCRDCQQEWEKINQ